MINNQNNNISCFIGTSEFELLDGSTRIMQELKQGDIIKTNMSYANVLCITRQQCKEIDLIKINDKLTVSKCHVVMVNGIYCFAQNCVNINSYKHDEELFVYNLVIDKYHLPIVGGIICSSLGHSIIGDVIGDSYYSTNRVINDLEHIHTDKQGYKNITNIIKDANNKTVKIE